MKDEYFMPGDRVRGLGFKGTVVRVAENGDLTIRWDDGQVSTGCMPKFFDRIG